MSRRIFVMLAILIAFSLLAGCLAPPVSSPIPSVPSSLMTAVSPAPSLVNADIPENSAETAVIDDPAELEKFRPLFGTHLQSDDLLEFVVSWYFDGIKYLIGFVYKHDGSDLVCNRLIGYKKVAAGYEQAFISSHFENPDEMIGEDFTDFETIGAEAYDLSDYLIVKTNEFLNEDEGLHNIFLLNENGLLDNTTGISFMLSPCDIMEFNGKLLYQDELWNEVTIKDDKLLFTGISNFSSYVPDINQNDFVINVLSFRDKGYNNEKQRPIGENYITIDINNGQKVLTKQSFIEKEEEYEEWSGSYMDYAFPKPFSMKKGGRIILLYPPLIRMNGYIYPEIDPEGIDESYTDLPGVVMRTPESSGTYSIEIGSENSFYHLTIDVT